MRSITPTENTAPDHSKNNRKPDWQRNAAVIPKKKYAHNINISPTARFRTLVAL